MKVEIIEEETRQENGKLSGNSIIDVNILSVILYHKCKLNSLDFLKVLYLKC